MRLPEKHAVSWVLLPLLLAGGSQSHGAAQDGVPHALRNMEQYRAALRTGVVNYSKQQIVDGKPWFRYWTARFAEEGLISTQRGDEEGVVMRTVEGDPIPFSKGPLHYFKGDDDVWVRFEDKPGTRLWPTKGTAMVPDLRTLGVMFGFSYGDLASTIWRDPGSQPGARTYSEEVDGAGLHVVTAKSDDRTINWWIDPKRGWSPVHTALYVRGELYLESRASMAEFDGVWFPETVHYYAKAHKDGKEPFTSVQVQSAEFNRPEHPLRLTPRDIGLEVGAPVDRVDGEGSQLGYGLFDGEKMVSFAEFRRQREQAAAARAQAARSSGAQARTDLGAWETEWQAYTRRFIEKYKLIEEQAEKARQILAQCEQRAAQVVRRIEPEFTQLTEELAQARKASDGGKVQKLIERLNALHKPIDDIFAEQLKPRLEKLPTRKQREAAEGKSESGDSAKSGGG